MAISEDNNVIIEFQWSNDNDPNEVLFVKHHNVDGEPTISVSETGEDWFNFKASFFAEVNNHLNQHRAIRSPVIPPKRTGLRTSSLPVGDGQVAVVAQSDHAAVPGGLPMPMIQRTMDNNGTLEPLEVADIDPLENLGSLAAIASKNIVAKPQSARRARQQKAQEEIISRPVIRAKTVEESAMLRGGGNPEKGFRRVD